MLLSDSKLHCQLMRQLCLHNSTNLVFLPVAVLMVCNKFTLANIELLGYKQIFNPSIIHSVDKSFVSRIFKNDVTAAIPLTGAPNSCSYAGIAVASIDNAVLD